MQILAQRCCFSCDFPLYLDALYLFISSDSVLKYRQNKARYFMIRLFYHLLSQFTTAVGIRDLLSQEAEGDALKTSEESEDKVSNAKSEVFVIHLFSSSSSSSTFLQRKMKSDFFLFTCIPVVYQAKRFKELFQLQALSKDVRQLTKR